MNFHCVDWNYIWRPILVLFSSLSKNSEELLWEGTLRQDIFLGRGTANSESEGSMSLNLLPIIANTFGENINMVKQMQMHIYLKILRHTKTIQTIMKKN